MSDEYTIRVAQSFKDIASESWNRLSGASRLPSTTPYNPFISHAFLSSLEPYVTNFNSAEAREKDDVDFVTGYFGHQRQDVVEWLKTVRWEEGLRKVEEKVVRDTLA